MQAFDAPKVPLVEDSSGVIRIANTRIQLETLVTAFDCGATPEEIVQDYPTLELSAVYSVIAYLLQNRPRVDAYMAERETSAAILRAQIEAHVPTNAGLRHRLLARAAQTKTQ
jgi:uncharacterized protein (DUF433 family)